MTVNLKGTDYELRWNLRSIVKFQDLKASDANGVRASINLIWAMLPKDAPFKTPDDVLDAVGDMDLDVFTEITDNLGDLIESSKKNSTAVQQ